MVIINNNNKKIKLKKIIVLYLFFFQVIIYTSIYIPYKDLNLLDNKIRNNYKQKGTFSFNSPSTSISKEWSIIWGDIAEDYSFDVATDKYNNVYVVGRSNSAECFLKKFNSSGKEEWTKTWGPYTFADGHGVAIDNSTLDIYVAGYTGPFGGPYNISLIKYNKSGDEQWSRIWPGSGLNYGYDVALDSKSNIYVVGSTTTPANDMILIKYNSSGYPQWNRTWNGGLNLAYGHGIVIDSLDNIYITGTSVFDYMSIHYEYAFLAKYNTSGEIKWDRIYYGGNIYNEGWAITVDSLGYVYFTGIGAMNSATDDHIFLRKLDKDGGTIWTETWNKAGHEKAFGLAVDSNNNVYVNGGFYNFTISDWNAIMLKYSNGGDLNWSNQYGGIEYDYGYGVSVDLLDNMYFSGNIDIGGDQDIYLIKYNISLETGHSTQNLFPDDDDSTSNDKHKKKDEINVLLVMFIIIILSEIGIIASSSTYIYKKWKKSIILIKRTEIKDSDYVLKDLNSIKEVLNYYIDNHQLLSIFEKEDNTIKIAQLLNKFNLTAFSVKFLELVVKFIWEKKDLIEFLNEMLCFTSKERLEIINDMIKKSKIHGDK